MRLETFSLDVPAAVTTGDEQRCEDLLDKWLQVNSTNFDGTLVIRATIDGSGWFDVASQGFEGSALVVALEVPQTCVSVRVDTTVASGGSAPLATLAGRNSRTQ